MSALSSTRLTFQRHCRDGLVPPVTVANGSARLPALLSDSTRSTVLPSSVTSENWLLFIFGSVTTRNGWGSVWPGNMAENAIVGVAGSGFATSAITIGLPVRTTRSETEKMFFTMVRNRLAQLVPRVAPNLRGDRHPSAWHPRTNAIRLRENVHVVPRAQWHAPSRYHRT